MADDRHPQQRTQFGQVGKLDLRRAILSGRRDGRRRLFCPGRDLAGPRPGTPLDPAEYVVSTPYIESVHQQVRATCGQLVYGLHRTQRTLRVQTYRCADAFVRLHDAGRPTRAACGRFSAWLNQWNGLLYEHGRTVDKTVGNGNYLIARYWEAAQTAHRHPASASGNRRPLCRSLIPQYVEIDPSWAKPDHFLLVRYRRGEQATDEPGQEIGTGNGGPATSLDDDLTDDPTAHAAWVLRRALDLMSQELKNPYPDDLDRRRKDYT
jgi:hypothetical protein